MPRLNQIRKGVLGLKCAWAGPLLGASVKYMRQSGGETSSGGLILQGLIRIEGHVILATQTRRGARI